MLDLISSYFTEYEYILITIGIVSGVVFIVSLLAMPWLLGTIPVDYFTNDNHCKNESHFFITVIKNLFGFVLLLVGVIMLVTPGQGIISILLGLFLMEFPGKRQLELKLINHNPTFKTLNWLRSKANKPPFKR